MFFFKKKNIKKEFDQKLIHTLVTTKEELERHSTLLEKSYEPHSDLYAQVTLQKRKYYFLLKEAKKRKVRIL